MYNNVPKQGVWGQKEDAPANLAMVDFSAVLQPRQPLSTTTVLLTSPSPSLHNLTPMSFK